MVRRGEREDGRSKRGKVREKSIERMIESNDVHLSITGVF